jgi:hypothetical protein
VRLSKGAYVHVQLAVYNPEKTRAQRPATMSDDKKRDDYTIEMGDLKDGRFNEPPPPPKSPFQSNPSHQSLMNHPMVPIASYCLSSISMTVANKYVLKEGFNLNFFFLCLQVRLAADALLHLLTQGVEHGLCTCSAHLQDYGFHHIPRFQH